MKRFLGMLVFAAVVVTASSASAQIAGRSGSFSGGAAAMQGGVRPMSPYDVWYAQRKLEMVQGMNRAALQAEFQAYQAEQDRYRAQLQRIRAKKEARQKLYRARIARQAPAKSKERSNP